MNNITRWDPFRELNAFQNTLNRVFQNEGRGQEELMTSGMFVPAVDIYEDKDFISLKVEVPGMKENDFDIRVENDMLTVRGERKFEKEEKEENFHRIERRYGAFSRSFTLPKTVDVDKVEAHYEAGVLNIKLAKKAEAKPKQIKIGVGKPAPKEVKGTAA
jgi:HSP20 family protein